MDVNKITFDMQVPLPPKEATFNKDRRNRVTYFIHWCVKNGYLLETVVLAVYLYHLVRELGLAPTSVKAHLTSVRSYLRELLENGTLQQIQLNLLDPDLPEDERQHKVAETISHVQQLIDPATVSINVQEVPPQNLSIGDDSINNLLAGLRLDSRPSLRDGALISLMCVTGARENELCRLTVQDLYHQQEDAIGLHVPSGRGCTERFIPYLGDAWALEIVQAWLDYAQIAQGWVFRGFYKSGNLIRETPLSPTAVESILKSYPIIFRNEPIVLKPLDLRRAYAGHLYRQHYDLEMIRRYLGVKRIQTVWDYVGPTRGLPFEEFRFDLSRLDQWK